MTVRRMGYAPYGGPLTREATRFLILPRFVFEEVFRSRIFTAFFAACFVLPAGAAAYIYLNHNLSALAALGLGQGVLRPVDGVFFLGFLSVQGAMTLLLALIVGPSLVAPDLSHGGLPLYLSRPFTRRDYVLGKLSVLAILMSAITWIPGLLLFFLQGVLAGAGWVGGNIRIAPALLIASWIWILLVSLAALAASAWARWKPLARALLLGVFFVAGAFGGTVNSILRTDWGDLFNIWRLVRMVWSRLFLPGVETTVPLWSAWAVLLAFCGACLWLLARRLRPVEVSR